jgi:hypothetical protein
MVGSEELEIRNGGVGTHLDVERDCGGQRHSPVNRQQHRLVSKKLRGKQFMHCAH